jgi:hypothetical protein
MEGSAAPPPPQQRFQGVQKESAGYRLLASMGWREGEGLGASKQGITEHIRVKKNFENWGVGAVSRRCQYGAPCWQLRAQAELRGTPLPSAAARPPNPMSTAASCPPRCTALCNLRVSDLRPPARPARR